MTSKLTEMRKSRGVSLASLATVVDSDQGTLSRVERGVQMPSRELARALYRYYDGAIGLGAIYDPEFAAEIGEPA